MRGGEVASRVPATITNVSSTASYIAAVTTRGYVRVRGQGGQGGYKEGMRRGQGGARRGKEGQGGDKGGGTRR